MKEYKSEDIFDIIGRGRVFAIKDVKKEEEPEIGEEVVIDGKVYKVKGIEAFQKMIPQATRNIGIIT